MDETARIIRAGNPRLDPGAACGQHGKNLRRVGFRQVDRCVIGAVRSKLPPAGDLCKPGLAADPVVTGWFSRDFLDCYMAMKRKEIEIVDGLAPDELCARYAAVY